MLGGGIRCVADGGVPLKRNALGRESFLRGVKRTAGVQGWFFSLVNLQASASEWVRVVDRQGECLSVSQSVSVALLSAGVN